MWGAIIGDVLGSSFEHDNLRSPYFEFYPKDSRFTDDTVCTIAVTNVLENNLYQDKDLISNEIRQMACPYLNRGFGSLFYQWIVNNVNQPYGSYGNGALMRISPVAKFAVNKGINKEEMLKIGERITEISHNHPQSIQAVQMYLSLLYDFLIYEKEHSEKIGLHHLEDAKKMIYEAFKKNNIQNPQSILSYRVHIGFDLTCNTSIGVACASVLETDNFDDGIRQVISVGGDSDTYAAIAGALLESIYGVPSYHMEKIKTYFKPHEKYLIEIIEKLYKQ